MVNEDHPLQKHKRFFGALEGELELFFQCSCVRERCISLYFQSGGRIPSVSGKIIMGANRKEPVRGCFNPSSRARCARTATRQAPAEEPPTIKPCYNDTEGYSHSTCDAIHCNPSRASLILAGNGFLGASRYEGAMQTTPNFCTSRRHDRAVSSSDPIVQLPP